MRYLSILLLAALLGGPPSLLQGAVWTVPNPHPFIQGALDSCASGDTVLVAPGHYHERLLVPNKAVTLGSQTLLTGDTLFIPQTILDGDSLGTVLTVAVGGLNRFILDGFTIQGGTGYLYHGGGIHFTDSTDVEIRNLHFVRNYSPESGVCVYAYGLQNPYRGPRRFIMRHIRAMDNYPGNSGRILFEITSNHYSESTNFICNNAISSILNLTSYDSVKVDGFYSSNSFCEDVLLGSGLLPPATNGHQQYKNIFINNTIWTSPIGSPLITLGGSSIGELNNIHLTNNTLTRHGQNQAHLINVHLKGAPSVFDSLFFTGNRGYVKGSTAGEIQCSRDITIDERVHGTITNLVVENCVLGDSSYTDWDSSVNYPSMLTTIACSVKNAVFRNNRITLTPGPDTPEWGIKGANIWRHETWIVDSISIKNVLFENNLVVDLDDNNALPVHWANEGRCLYMDTGTYQSFVVDSVVFDGNRQPNYAAELPYGGMFDDGQDVGSVMHLYGPGAAPPGNIPKQFSNLVFRNNDDGGLRAEQEWDLRFRNVQMINMSRQGLDLQAESVTLENVFIDGCTPYAPIATRSEQMPLRLEVTQPSTVSNCTIINSTTPYVVMAGVTPYEEPRVPIVTFENCLFADNQYDRFEALVPQYDWPGWDSYRPGRFNHCLLPEAPDYGADNLIGLDPLFDAEWGPPNLSPLSPCVDAGNPDPVWNDLEDLSHPGFAMWPSLGTLANDIGFTGGPWAQPFDTNWVALPRWEPRLEPANFTLGIPWPNPFNPVTQIPLELARPSLVRLTVHNVLGQQVAVLCNGLLPAGRRIFCWDAAGQGSGLYFVTLQVDLDKTATRAVTLLR